MAFVQFNRVSLAFGDRDILKDVSLNLSSGSRAGLMGANGSGKSTLLKVIAGKIQADSGDRALMRDSRISYLPQAGDALQGREYRGRTLLEEAETAYGEIRAMLARIEEIGRALESAQRDDRRTRALVEEHHRLQEEVENSGFYSRDQHIAMVLEGLGFSPADKTRRVEEFSGGWQMRIALAKVLLENPDILLLDEPTNYLDIEARSWLETWLRSFTGGYLLVSHDRYFLDLTVTEVYELFQGRLKRYAGNYSAYENTRQVEMESLVKRYAAQQEEIAKSEDLIRRFRYKATKAAMVQERIKRLEKMERIELPESLKKISITFPPPPRSGRIALTLSGIGKSYGPRRVLEGLDLSLESGEKLVVVGRNGAGKSTLLRIIAGADRAFEGTVQYGTGVLPGYFSQDAAESLWNSSTGAADPQVSPAAASASAAGPTALEFLEAEAPTALIPKVRDMLGAFLFRGDDVYKPIGVLSGGEKSRLALLRMLLKPLNLLILDEPTNHLDIYSKEILLDTLKKYRGTVIFVSHDRAFMEALSTKTLELSASSVPREPSVPRGLGGLSAPGDVPRVHRLFYGDYAYYLDRIAREAASPPLSAAPVTAATPPGPSPRSDPPPALVSDTGAAPAGTVPGTGLPRVILIKADKPGDTETGAGTELGSAGTDRTANTPLDAAERREAVKRRQTLVRRLERQEAEILAALEGLEAERAALEAELGRPAVYSSGEKARAAQAKLRDLAAAIEVKTREWEERAEELARARE
jgi:ATP-binding cassette subfamily F protein 3